MTWHRHLFNKDKSMYQEVRLTKDEFDVGLGASMTESSYDVALSPVQRRQVDISRSSTSSTWDLDSLRQRVCTRRYQCLFVI